METKPQKQTGFTLKYPTLKDWYKAVDTCLSVEGLNELAKDLKVGQNGGTIHRLKENGQMALATSALNKRADQLNCYKVSDGTYRKHSTSNGHHGTK